MIKIIVLIVKELNICFVFLLLLKFLFLSLKNIVAKVLTTTLFKNDFNRFDYSLFNQNSY